MVSSKKVKVRPIAICSGAVVFERDCRDDLKEQVRVRFGSFAKPFASVREMEDQQQHRAARREERSPGAGMGIVRVDMNLVFNCMAFLLRAPAR
jgi:hypothetical protein